MVVRYGDFVLYRPPVKSTTLLLWAGPTVLLLLGIFLVTSTAVVLINLLTDIVYVLVDPRARAA